VGIFVARMCSVVRHTGPMVNEDYERGKTSDAVKIFG